MKDGTGTNSFEKAFYPNQESMTKDKPFFAEYIPVEGEIKDDDWTYSKEHGYDKYSNWAEDEKPFVKKVKLFLCSRDIQVDDTFSYTTPDGKTLEQVATEDTVEALKTWTLPYWKVIGEISPDATWVKEGDEFDGDDLKVLFRELEFWGPKGNQGSTVVYKLSDRNLDFLLKHWKDNVPWKDGLSTFTDGTKDLVAVKGPCGHFH